MIETIIEKANESKKLLEEIAYISGNERNEKTIKPLLKRRCAAS